MLNDQTVKKLRSQGWVFYWNKSTWYVGANHPKGGKISVCEIRPSPHFDSDEIGQLLADKLNACIDDPKEWQTPG